jgi:hypothetical protein
VTGLSSIVTKATRLLMICLLMMASRGWVDMMYIVLSMQCLAPRSSSNNFNASHP